MPPSSRTSRTGGALSSAPPARTGTHSRMGQIPPRFRRCSERPKTPSPRYHPWGQTSRDGLAPHFHRLTLAKRSSPGPVARTSYLDGFPSITAMRFAGRSRPVGFCRLFAREAPTPGGAEPPTEPSQVIDGNHPNGHVDRAAVTPRADTVCPGCARHSFHQDLHPA